MESAGTNRSNHWNRMTLLLIGGIPLLVLITATWLWVYVVRGDLDLVGMIGTQNRGTLVQPPLAIDDLALTGLDGQTIAYADSGHLWTLLIPGGAECDSGCVDTLYLTRQVHIALGSESRRVRRYYLNLEGKADRAALQLMADHHPNLQTVVASRVAFLELLATSGLADTALAPGTWYVVDPMGWIMMVYNAANTYKDPITDLKFLLKNTSEENLP